MRLIRLYAGSWAPSSTIHLKEFFRALSELDSPYFSKKDLRTWSRGMEVEEIEYQADAINVVRGIFKNQIRFQVLEDGMIIVESELENPEKDIQRLTFFLTQKMVRFWENLFGRHTNQPEVFLDIASTTPLLITVADATANDLDRLFATAKVVPYKRIKMEHGEAWIGEALVVINSVRFTPEQLESTIEHLLFARLYELQLERLLKGYHLLWNKVEGIRSRRYIQSRDLQGLHNQVLNIHNQANFFTSRLKQMSYFLSWRRKLIDEYVKDTILNQTFKHFFTSLLSSQSYLEELWQMLSRHIDATVEWIAFLYSDNQRKELGILQKLFLVSTVGAFIGLGTIAGSKIITMDPTGALISSAVVSAWSLDSLWAFGIIVLTVSFLIYILLFVAFYKLKRIPVFRGSVKLKKN